MTTANRRILLRRRPDGLPDASCFEHVEAAVPTVGEGEALVRVTHLSVDPTNRVWIGRDSYLPAVPIGDVVRAAGLGVVLESNRPDMSSGDTVIGMVGWQDCVLLGKDDTAQVVPPGLEPTDVLSIYGATGLTAYFGMLEIGDPKPSDTVVVSGAAGGVGSVAGQLAKIRECRVIGIAGTPEKCRWIVEDLGFDAAIDYKNEDVGERLDALCPDGIDVYFDNVGGEILDAALARLSIGARIPLCGAISEYNAADGEDRYGIRNYFELIAKRGRMEGFLILDYVDRFLEAIMAMAPWVAEGRIKYAVDVIDGLENAPAALNRLFSGEHTGKLVVKVS